MESIYNWAQAHQALVGVGSTLFVLIIGAIATRDKMMKIGFMLSQFLRRTFGAKVEEKIEDIIDALDKGMESDNPKEDKK
jgi:hypothetical protein